MLLLINIEMKIKLLFILLTIFCITNVHADDSEIFKEVALSGKLITAEDPITIGDNFQQITNLRYRRTNPFGIGGMSEINTTPVTSVPQMANGYHFIKNQPAESHVLIQGRDGSDANPIIFQNITAIPSQGQMVGTATPTALYTEDTGAGMARFSSAPGGNVVICDNIDCLLWGGDESQIGAFITSTATITAEPTNPRDYSDEVRNTIDSATERAILGGGISSDTVLMLHMDEPDGGTDFTDSSATGHTTTANNDAETDTAVLKFGVSSGLFGGDDDYVTVGVHNDFDFSADDKFNLDIWIYINTLDATDQVLYYQEIDATNYMKLFIAGTTDILTFEVQDDADGGDTNTLASTGALSAGQWYHVMASADGSNYYISQDGVVESQAITDGLEDYTSSTYIGSNDTPAEYFDGWMDEFRLNGINVNGWSSTFTPPIRAYLDNALDFIVGATRPLDGAKFYIGVANTETSTLSGKYWDGNAWTTLSSFVDNTSTGGVSLGKTIGSGYTTTWTSTVDLAKPKYIDGLYLYWYNFTLSAGGAELYHVTVTAPMQKMNDIWNGEYVQLTDAKIYQGGYTNDAVPVSAPDWINANTTTYWALNSHPNTVYYVFGFTDKMTALFFNFSENVNVNANATTMFYWDGSDWSSVGDITDGTIDSGATKTFNTSGVISWNTPSAGVEYKTTIAGSVPMYFYKVAHSGNFSAAVHLDYVAGIPVNKTIPSFKFPVHSKDRLFLCSEQSQDKNKCLVSAIDTANVWNGEDFTELEFGNETELMGGTSLYSRLGSSIYEVTLFFKRNAIFGLTGSDLEDFTTYLISNSVGLAAPLTLQVTTIQTPQGSKPIAIWQGADGVYLFDNTSPILISEDISNLFDDRESASRIINPSYIDTSVAFIDHDNHEYHLLFADGNSSGLLNREFVFDYVLLKWYEIDRGVGDTGGDKDDLQAGFSVQDTIGNYYTYGLTDEGDMLRLENGNTFDGDDITHTLWTGAFTPVQGSIMWNVKPIRHKLVMKSKATTTNTVAITHYLDRKATGTSLTVADPTNTGFSIADVLQEGNIFYDPGIFHSFKYVMTTNNESVGFEPIAIGIKFDIEREDTY